jgi:hypothetical protein
MGDLAGCPNEDVGAELVATATECIKQATVDGK